MAFIRLRLGSVHRTDGNTCKMRHQGDRLHRGNGGADHRGSVTTRRCRTDRPAW